MIGFHIVGYFSKVIVRKIKLPSCLLRLSLYCNENNDMQLIFAIMISETEFVL